MSVLTAECRARLEARAAKGQRPVVRGNDVTVAPAQTVDAYELLFDVGGERYDREYIDARSDVTANATATLVVAEVAEIFGTR